MKIRKRTDLSTKDEPYFHACFEILQGEIFLAKASLYINPHHKVKNQQACSIGDFECPDDQIVFDFLLDHIVAELGRLGFYRLIGPMNGSTWDQYRLLTKANYGPFLLDVDTPTYYLGLFENYGFTRLANYKSTFAEKLVVNWDKVSSVYDGLVKKGVEFRGFKKEEAGAEFGKISDLCQLAFRANFLYSPISKSDFVEKMMPSLTLINPRYTVLAVLEDNVVGFIFSYADLNDKSGKTIVVKTLARDPSKDYQGIGSVLSSIVMKQAKEDGFEKGIHALMVNSNTSTYISKKFKAEVMREYALMSLEIE